MPSPLSSPFPLTAVVRDGVELLGQEFLADILMRETERRPENLDALGDLAQVLTNLGRIEEGLAVDRRLVECAPNDPTAHYNLACSLALLHKTDEAFEVLARAIDRGYSDSEHLLADSDLNSLHSDPRFPELVARLRASEQQ